MIRDIQHIDDDIIMAERLIEEKLYSDPDIIEALHNPELNPDEPDTYIGKNIFPSLHIPGTITNVQNLICFDIKQVESIDSNSHMKSQAYIFMIFCHVDDLITPYGMARHNLLGYLIRDLFNYSNIFGTQLMLDSNVPGIAETDYSIRTMTFLTTTPNSLQRGVRTNKYEFGQ